MRQTTPTPRPPQRPPAPAVGRAFLILDLLAREPVPLGVSQIAAALGLGKATVHALLRALAAVGAVEPTEEKKYRLGPVVETLAASRRKGRTLEEACLPLVRRLAADLEQTVSLGVPDADRLRIAAVVEGGCELRIGAAAGQRIPLLAGAHGKVLAAWKPQRAPALPADSPDRQGVEAELEQVRQAGVAYDRGEYLEGVVAAAAPVLDATGRVVAVLYAVGLRDLVGEPGLRQAGEAVGRAARVASEALGSRF